MADLRLVGYLTGAHALDHLNTPIGRVQSSFDSPVDVTHDAVAEATGRVVLDDEYEDGLDGLEEFSHVVVLAHLDGTPVLDVKPYVPAVDDETDLSPGWLDDR
jgi:tRNA (Thr-GGU) A37 N-methylase